MLSSNITHRYRQSVCLYSVGSLPQLGPGLLQLVRYCVEVDRPRGALVLPEFIVCGNLDLVMTILALFIEVT